MRTIKTNYFTIIILLLFILIQISACKFDEQIISDSNGFPEQIAPIMLKCSNAGCHNDISKDGAGGLSLSTWDKMFEGGNGGSACIPYSTTYSTLLYYTNTDSTKGPTLLPTMPYNSAPLNASEYELLREWIRIGAPDKKGNIKFSAVDDIQKLYICNKGCDVVTVMDAGNGLAMRYIPVGNTDAVEAPSVVKVSPDKLYWYVAFENSTILQKFRVSDNQLVGQLEIELGIWSSITITKDSRKAFLTDNQYLGRIKYIDLETMQVIATYNSGIKYPLSCTINNAQNQLYITSSVGNYIYKMDITDIQQPILNKLVLEPGQIPNENYSLNPYDIVLSPDESRYFVSCTRSSELRVFNTIDDSLVEVFSVGSNPAKIYISKSTPYLFLSCMGAPGTVKLSSVYVFNYLTNEFVTEIYAGFESRGFSMDESAKMLYVANRNVSAGGPAAHHEAICAGKNGYITAIDVNTLKLVDGYRKEVSVDPYDMDICSPK